MKFIQAPNLHAKQSGGAVVILESNKRFVRELNSTAGFIWGTLRTPQSFEGIVDRVWKEFDVEKETAMRDVREFLDEYRKAGLIRCG